MQELLLTSQTSAGASLDRAGAAWLAARELPSSAKTARKNTRDAGRILHRKARSYDQFTISKHPRRGQRRGIQTRTVPHWGTTIYNTFAGSSEPAIAICNQRGQVY